MEDESYIPSNIELIDKFIQQDIQNLSLSEKEIADKRNTILAIFAEWRIADSENKNQINNSKIVLPSQDIAPEIVIIPGIFHGTTTHHEYSISEKNYIKDNKIYKSNLPSQYILDIYCDIGTIHTHVYKINSDETGAELTFDIYETPQYEGDNYPKKDTEKPVSYIRTLYINDRFVPNEFRGQGIGIELLEIVDQVAMSLHCDLTYGRLIANSGGDQSLLEQGHIKKGYTILQSNAIKPYTPHGEKQLEKAKKRYQSSY